MPRAPVSPPLTLVALQPLATTPGYQGAEVSALDVGKAALVDLLEGSLVNEL